MVRGRAALIILPLLGFESRQFNIPERLLPLLNDAVFAFKQNRRLFTSDESIEPSGPTCDSTEAAPRFQSDESKCRSDLPKRKAS